MNVHLRSSMLTVHNKSLNTQHELLTMHSGSLIQPFCFVVADTCTFHNMCPTEAGCLIFTPHQGQQEVLVIPGGVADDIAGHRGLEPGLVLLFDPLHADLGPGHDRPGKSLLVRSKS